MKHPSVLAAAVGLFLIVSASTAFAREMSNVGTCDQLRGFAGVQCTRGARKTKSSVGAARMRPSRRGVLQGEFAREKRVSSSSAFSSSSSTSSSVGAAASFVTITGSDHVWGNRGAIISILEYADFECGFCKTHRATLEKILVTYGDTVNVVYRHFPLAFHRNAKREAEAAECAAVAGGNDGFWQYHDALFEKTASGGVGFDRGKLAQLAADLGLNEKEFRACFNGNDAAQQVHLQALQAKDAGVTGTPTNFVIDAKTGEYKMIVGAVPFDEFKTVIEGMLRKK